MSDADPLFNTQSAAIRSATRRSSSQTLNHHRRRSTSERIDEILQNGRDRADTLASVSMTTPNSPTVLMRRSRTTLSFDEGRVDETTAMLARRLTPNYQTVGDGDDDYYYDDSLRISNGNGIFDGDSSPRMRRSIYTRSQVPLIDDPLRISEESSDPLRMTDSATASPIEARPPSLWQTAIGPFLSVELENKGSVARDHLALERTFLAWLRTSLAFASIGIAVTQLFRLNTSLPDNVSGIDQTRLRGVGKPLGAAFLIVSIIILLLGYRRYFEGQRWIIKGKFPASRGTVIIISLVALAVMTLSLAVVIVIHPKHDDV